MEMLIRKVHYATFSEIFFAKLIQLSRSGAWMGICWMESTCVWGPTIGDSSYFLTILLTNNKLFLFSVTFNNN